ncbi:MAG TPA: TadA family conjugal transfer-associated ATPase [Pilimelia sp.]|nr:TadA family conjugal transfer-associated ATPase [Pilimelia sp.]
MRGRFVTERRAATRAEVVAALRADERTAVLGDSTVLRLAQRVHQDLAGAGPLAELLADPEVTDLLVNNTQVWVDRGRGLERVPVELGGADEVRRLAQRIAAGAGRRLDDACPFVDALLPEGTRLHAVLPPVAADGPYLSLRTFRSRPFDLSELVAQGTVAPAAAELLAAVVAARLAYLVVGGTGSGKTTLLATLLGLVPGTERIVLVEDAAELRPVHPHVARLQCRTPNVEGAGAVELRDLVRQALRMRPDRLVVGECRGAEVVDLLAALNTGHDGGAGTLHANTAADVPARLEALGLLGGLSRPALHAQVAAALQVVLQLRRRGRGRVLESVSLLLPAGPDRLVTAVPAWHREYGEGPAAVELRRRLRERGVPVAASPVAGRGGDPAAPGVPPPPGPDDEPPARDGGPWASPPPAQGRPR